jgi:hypothetical protein
MNCIVLFFVGLPVVLLALPVSSAVLQDYVALERLENDFNPRRCVADAFALGMSAVGRHSGTVPAFLLLELFGRW